MANKSLPNERVNKIGTPMKKTKSKNKKRQQAETKIVEEKHEQTGSSSKLLFCVCVIGIFTSYLIYGLIQEAL